MRKKRKARPTPPTGRKTRQCRPRDVRPAIDEGSGLQFDDATILAGAAAMRRNDGNYNDAALAAAAVYTHPRLTPAERAAWRKLIGSGLRAATAAQDHTFRRRLIAGGARLIRVHPALAPEVRTAWRAFAVDPDVACGAVGTLPETPGLVRADPDGLPPVIDLVAVMQESWRRLRLVIEQDPDWYNRACTIPSGPH